MSASLPVQLPPQDKLDALRYLDEFHFWQTLDDERLCRRCGCTITGRQILVFELHGTRGSLRLQCPSPGCVSKPGEWVYANPVRAARMRAEAEASASAPPEKVAGNERIHQGDRWTKTPPKVPPHGIRAAIARLASPIVAKLHALRPIA